MTTMQSMMLKAMSFVLATLGATGLLVAAGLAEEPQQSTSTCLFCLSSNPG